MCVTLQICKMSTDICIRTKQHFRLCELTQFDLWTLSLPCSSCIWWTDITSLVRSSFSENVSERNLHFPVLCIQNKCSVCFVHISCSTAQLCFFSLHWFYFLSSFDIWTLKRHIKLCWSLINYRVGSVCTRVCIHVHMTECLFIYVRTSCWGLHAGSARGSASQFITVGTVQGFVMWTSLVPLPLVVVVMMYCVVACWLVGCCSRCSVCAWVVFWGTVCLVSSSVWPSDIT